ncbi:hypothetical protein MD484_g8626, partial [Candolleomyces efflorescens]
MILNDQIPRDLAHLRICARNATADFDSTWNGRGLQWVVHTPNLDPSPSDSTPHFTLRGYLPEGYAIRTLHVYSDIAGGYHPFENGGDKYGIKRTRRGVRFPKRRMAFASRCIYL